MSDVPPPSLRLKPRARVDGEAPAVTNADPQSPLPGDTGPDTSESPKLRLRPKLDLSSTTPVADSPELPQPLLDTPPVKSTFSLKPRLNPETLKTQPEPTIPAGLPPPPASAASVEPPKFKLKEKAPADAPLPAPMASANPTAPTPPPLAPVSSSGSGTIPPILVAEAPAPKPATSFPPPVPKLNTKKIVDDTAEDDDAAPGKSSAKLAVYVLALLLVGGGFFAYLKLKPKPVVPTPAKPVAVAPAAVTPAATAAVTADDPKRPSTPSATLNELSTVPARAINKAKDTIATVNATENGRVDAVVDEDPSATSQRRPKAAPKPAVKPAATSTTEIAPGIKATTTATDNVNGDPSPEFRTWVAQARVSGVFQGTPPRVLINGRTVSATQLVDETLQITFDGIDSTNKTLIFKDHTGATVSRKF